MINAQGNIRCTYVFRFGIHSNIRVNTRYQITDGLPHFLFSCCISLQPDSDHGCLGRGCLACIQGIFKQTEKGIRGELACDESEKVFFRPGLLYAPAAVFAEVAAVEAAVLDVEAIFTLQ
jgi:hypothetical protein